MTGFCSKYAATNVLARSAILCSIGALMSGTSAYAQQAQASSSSDEIVVTAQKRVERLTDVPMSITTASGDQLTKQGITDTAQLTKLVPGFTFQQASYGSPVFAIRGIGFYDNSLLAGPAVTAYIDQVALPLSSMTKGATLDIERVEVLKGPQGTLFGMNSTGGAINYIAAKPTDTFKAGFDLGYGRFNEVIAGGFVSGPLSDTLRARIAVRGEHMDGWQISATRPGDKNGNKRFYNGRLLVDWTPSDRVKFEANISGWQDKGETPAVQNDFVTSPHSAFHPVTEYVWDAINAAPSHPSNPRVADWDPGFDLSRNDKFYLLSLRGDWQVTDAVNLTSITGYSRLTTSRPVDLDGMAFSHFRFEVSKGRVNTFSQELRLSGDQGKLKWMVGGNYQRVDGHEYQRLFFQASVGYLDLGPLGTYYQVGSAYFNNQRPVTKSGFGSLDYEITDQLTAQASVRYTTETRKFSGCLADAGLPPIGASSPIRTVFAGLPTVVAILNGSTNPPAPAEVAPFGCLTIDAVTFKPGLVRNTLKEDNVAWRASLNWKPGNDTLLYANVSKGYKAGSFSILPAITSTQFTPVKQESVLAYEGGFKVALADRKVQLNGAIFYYDYTDKQLVGYYDSHFFGSLITLITIPKSRVYGAELEATIRPVEGLRFSGGVTYVNSKAQSDPAPPNQAIDPVDTSVVTTFVGEQFPNTPKWQAVGDAEYEFPVNDSLKAFFGGSATYRSHAFSTFGENPFFNIRGYALLDLRAGLESGRWRFQLWGRNITNKLYVVNYQHPVDTVFRQVGMPATYGATLSFRY